MTSIYPPIVPCDISIIIVNWNSHEYTRQCIGSIQKNTIGLSYEIIVVDNASYDGIQDLIGEEFPKVKFIQSTTNIGFAKANNLGASYASGKYLLFINPDTVPVGNAVGVLFEKARELKNAGAIGARLLNSDMSVQTSCIQRFPTIFRQIFFADIVLVRLKNIKYFGISPLFHRTENPVPVEAVSGACICIRKNVFDEVGGFSGEYFMYSEDVDLCRKLINNNYVNYYIDCAEIIHYGKSSSRKVEKQSNFSIVMTREAIYKYLSKFEGYWYAKIYKIVLMLNALFRIGLLSSMMLCKGYRSIDKLITSKEKWTKILRWSLGCERWVEKYN